LEREKIEDLDEWTAAWHESINLEVVAIMESQDSAAKFQ
jgi:hypothetical protein